MVDRSDEALTELDEVIRLMEAKQPEQCKKGIHTFPIDYRKHEQSKCIQCGVTRTKRHIIRFSAGIHSEYVGHVKVREPVPGLYECMHEYIMIDVDDDMSFGKCQWCGHVKYAKDITYGEWAEHADV